MPPCCTSRRTPKPCSGCTSRSIGSGRIRSSTSAVFTQTDKSFYTGVAKSKSERFIFIHMESTVSSEWRYAEADDPSLTFQVFLPHERDHEYQIEHLGDRFIVRTNWRALNFRLMQAPIGGAPDRADWQDVVAHRDDTFIQDFEVFERFIAVSVRNGGLKKISILPLPPAAAGGARAGRPYAGRPRILHLERRAGVQHGHFGESGAGHRRRALHLFLAHHADDGL